jgi:DNA polymerase III subunit epsilon
MKFLAIDLEMTGLNASHDHIVSIGWVPIRNLQIDIELAYSSLISTPTSVGNSATVHGIHDHQLRDGASLKDVMEILVRQFTGYTLIFHHAALDLEFLQRSIKRSGMEGFSFDFLDTLVIERKRLSRVGYPLRWDSLTLSCCLERHGLPMGKQHEALSDAFACAQLFLCQLQKYQGEYIDISRVQ